jgi:hypothetical protein
MQYAFKRNANNNVTAVVVHMEENGRGGIVGIFEICVKQDEFGQCESVKIHGVNKKNGSEVRAIYDAFSDYWCYEGEDYRYDGAPPVKPCVGFTEDMLNALPHGCLVVQGTEKTGRKLIADNAQEIVRKMRPQEYRPLIFAGGPK